MILALDVYYERSQSKAVGFLFNVFDSIPTKQVEVFIDKVENYIPGEFYRRELPCLLQVIKKVDLSEVECIIIDGNVYSSNDGKYGLGGILFQALQEKVPIIGVAKNIFKNSEEKCIALKRGKSQKPLWVSSIGMDNENAANIIAQLKGENRIPDILKKLDYATRN